jgi:hypothetical protein
MKEQIKRFLNEEQDPKAIEKVTSKLNDLLMKNEEIGYIAVQKKPALTVFPDSIVLTNKRIIICQPKNLGLSMDFIDYAWDQVEGTFVKENILGSAFSFSTKTDVNVSIDYIPKIQARKIFTYAKEQLDILKNGVFPNAVTVEDVSIDSTNEFEIVEVMETEDVSSFKELIPSATSPFTIESGHFDTSIETLKENGLSGLSQEEIFEKLQNFKRLLDNGLILQVEYDAFKKQILNNM